MNFGIFLIIEFARFTRILGSKLATISSGRLFTSTFSMHKNSEFLSWFADLSTKMSNGSMFLDYLAKLELLTQFGLKTYTLTPGFIRIVLLGLRTLILSTCVMLHTASVTISSELIVLRGDKLFSKIFTHNVSWTLLTRSCLMNLMTAGSKRIGLTDHLQILSVMLISPFGSLLGSTCLLESILISTCSSDS